MPRTRIKICGITRNEDALAAARLGADAIGLVFHDSSPRAVKPSMITALLKDLPPFVTVVGLVVNPEPAQVHAILASGLVQCLQFHGQEPAVFIQGFPLPRLKAIRVQDSSALDSLAAYQGVATILLDAYDPQAAGGTGRSFDWSIARRAVTQGHDSLVLAGGLTADNVGEAIIQVRPWGVDVSSGVEAAPGIKDAMKMERFIATVREADTRLHHQR
ncbi:MAG: hypothetical protein RLZZ385_2340 [Pseudomonadota bacterium]